MNSEYDPTEDPRLSALRNPQMPIEPVPGQGLPGMMPRPDDARMAALRRQQMIGQLGMIGDIPGVQQSAKSLVDSANREIVPPGQGFNQMMAMLGMQNQQRNAEANREIKEQQIEQTKQGRVLQRTLQQEKLDRDRQKYLDSQKQKFNKEVTGGVVGLGGAFQELRDVMSGIPKLDSDLPGIGAMDANMPDFMKDAIQKRASSAISAIENTLLSERSGAAVTDQEMARMRKELANYDKASNDAEALRALDRLRSVYDETMRRIYSSYDSEALGQMGIEYRPVGPLHPGLAPADDQEIIDLPSRM